MINFIIPTTREDLLTCTAGQYHVEDVFSTRLIPIKIQEAKPDLLREGGILIHKHFEVFFSVASKFYELDPTVKQLSWSLLTKACERFSNTLHQMLNRVNDGGKILEASQCAKYQNALKMNVYLLVQLAEQYHSASMQNMSLATPSKGKKQNKTKGFENNLGINWESECQKAVQLLMNYVDLDIHRLWKDQLVEDEFTSLISTLCYRLLEDPSSVKSKGIKTAVFHLLGCIIKKHNQALSASLKLVQMLQHFEHVAAPMAEAVTIWISTFKCKTLVCEILREISQIDEKEFVRDSVSTKTMCSFILELARVVPSDVLTHISLLLSRMDEESYQMRNTVLGVMGEILIQCLNGEGLDDKAKGDRDQFLDILHDHANLDMNAFVRSKALHIYLNLVKDQALPIKRCPELVDLCVRLLLDRSNLVRKATVQLLECLLRWNPFAATLSINVLQDGLDDAKQKLKEMYENNAAALKSPHDSGAEELVTIENKENKENSEIIEDAVPPKPEADEVNAGVIDEDPDSVPGTEKQKAIITYLSESICFVEKFHEAVPVLCQLLKSKTQSDVLEAINFFTAAWEFKLGFAVQGIAAMLDQIWNEEQKVRDAVVFAYGELYFKQDSSRSETHAGQIVDNMIVLAANSTTEKLHAIEALIGEMQKSGDIPSGVVPQLWDRFVNPPSSFTMERGISEILQQKVIVQLLGMFANSKPQMLTLKVNILVDVGLKDVIKDMSLRSGKLLDFELAMHTCGTLSKLASRTVEAGKYIQQFRLADDHQMFNSLTHLIVDGFDKESENWIRFAMQALTAIFQLAEHPVNIATTIFTKTKETLDAEISNENATSTRTDRLLSRFFSIVGQIALKLLIFVDGDIQSEIKRQRKIEDEKEEAEKKAKKKGRKIDEINKGEANLEEEMGVGGATADDADQEMIKNILEHEIVGPDTLLGDVSEMLVRCCALDIAENDTTAVQVQNSAALAFTKYMLVSSEFCERHLRLFFTMLENSPFEAIRANLTVGAGDLCIRYPNLLEPWTANIYARLTDKSNVVRIYAIKVLTNLILNDMIKVKGHVSEMAKCICDENDRISMLAKQFFQELSKKGNAVYNVMPDIISRLSDPDVGVSDEVDFKTIMRFLFDFIQKEKQTESLVEKLCYRFRATRMQQQWRDLAFCLSLLNYSEKATKKLSESFSFYCEMLRDEQVYYSFNNIITKCKKLSKPEIKVQVDELEGKIIDQHTKGVSEDESAAKAAEAAKQFKLPETESSTSQPGNKRTVVASTRKTKSRKKRRENDWSDEEAERPNTTSVANRRPTRKRVPRKKQVLDFSSDEDSDFHDDMKENVQDIPATMTSNEKEEGIDDDNDDDVSTPIRRKKTPQRKGSRSVLRA
ncbi:unnamed protein product [Clavelina lepadiformis]|uniref:Condensin complex subunit 1 n=1 Tax=Clavelina lepadiformis TaxID=159417 RepID=A0ABP0H2C4_CLALP